MFQITNVTRNDYGAYACLDGNITEQIYVYVHCKYQYITYMVRYCNFIYINARETRRGNQEWTIQRHLQHWAHKTKDGQIKHKNATQHRKLQHWFSMFNIL
jgi:hypothetical protein